jgi:hypothetical protein
MDTIKNDYSSTREFLNKVANSAILFQDPFTELTRKQQGILLVASIASILLSLAIVNTTEWELGGAKLIIQRPDLIVKIGGLVCAYLLVVYIINAYQNILSYQYRILPAQTEMYIVAIENMETILDKRAKADPIMSKMAELGDHRRKLGREWQALIKDYESKRAKIDKEMNEFKSQMEEAGHSYSEIHNMPKYLELQEARRQIDLQKEIDEKPYEETILDRDHDWDGMSQLEAELKVLTKNEEIDSQSKALKKLFQEYNWLSKIRTVLEIVFPTGVAIYAIWLALLANLF